MQRLVPPFRGASNSTGYFDTPLGLIPYSVDADGLPRLRNAVPHNPSAKDRGQIGQRAGHGYVFDVQCGGPGGAAWQTLISVSRSSVLEGVVVGSCETVTSGVSLESGSLEGNYWQFDSAPSMDGMGALADDTGSETNGVQAAAVCPLRFTNADGDGYYLYYVVTNYTGFDGFGESKIRCVRDDTGATVWEYTIEQALTNCFVNSATSSDYFLFVCTNEKVLMLRNTDGTAVVTNDLSGWSQEAIKACVWKRPSDETEWLFVAFNGSSVAGTTLAPSSLVITAGHPASMFRSGIMRFQINNEHVNPTGPYSDSRPLIKDASGWGQTLVSGNPDNVASPFCEGFHGYFRVSERSRVTGHGCYITDMTVNPADGSLIATRTNQGYGPNASYPPDGLVYEPISVFCVSFAGLLLWEEDYGSVLEPGLDGYINDIPTSTTDDPSLSAVDCNAIGVACVAGRQQMAVPAVSAIGIDAATGTPIWAANVQSSTGSVRQGAIDVDPTDQHFWIGGDRNDDWDGADPGDNRHMWKLNPTTGAIVRTFDLNENVSALAVACMGDGSFVYGTDYVT